MHNLMRRLGPTGLALTLSSVLLFPALPGPSQQGAEFTVDSQLDEVDAIPGDGACVSFPSGVCTLRAAVMEANALTTDDTIRIPGGPAFPAPALSIPGAPEDASATGDLDIVGTLSIVGDGMMLSGADAYALGDRALHVLPGSVLNLSGLSFWNANAGSEADGGGLLNEGTVSMVESSFQSNQARSGAGVMNLGEMHLTRSVIGYNFAAASGAGIFNQGMLTIEASTIAENNAQAGAGGGIENYGNLDLRNSTVSFNYATSRAAAIDNRTGAVAVLNNATVYSNFTYAAGPETTGGILAEQPDSVTLGNTILTMNATNSGYSDCLGTLFSRGYNLFGFIPGCSFSGDTTGHLVGVDSQLPYYPTVEPIGTWGYPPQEGSPGINAGNPLPVGSDPAACEIIDQRGYARPIGLVCDIGAFEVEPGAGGTPSPPPTISIPTFTPTVTQTSTPTFTFTPTVTATPTVTRTGTVPTPTRSLTPSRTPTPTSTRTKTPSRTPTPTRTGSPTQTRTWTPTPIYTFTASPTATPSLTYTPTASLTPTPHVPHGLYVPQQYPFIQLAIDSALDGDWVVVSPGTYHEHIDLMGKAIAVVGERQDLTFIDGDGTGPVVTFDSGEGRTTSLGGFTIRNGNAFNGAGIFVQGASPHLSSLIVEDNQGCSGVGIYISQGSPLIEGSVIRRNRQTTCSGGPGGGGILIVGSGEAYIVRNVIEDNISSTLGGGISLFASGTPHIEANVFRGNQASQGGGLSMVNHSDAAVIQNLIIDNSATDGGGFYWLVPSGHQGPSLVNNTVYGNVAGRGSAVFADGYDAQALLVNNLLISPADQVALYCGDFNDANPPILRANNIFSLSGPPTGGICADPAGQNGNISAEPALYDPTSGDYHLTSLSPGIDGGDNSAPGLPDADFDYEARIMDADLDGLPEVDMGYDEFSGVVGIFADGFESGDLSAWSSAQTDLGDLRVTTEAAIGGSYGLQAVLDDNRSIYVVDETPAMEDAYQVRFYFDPNSISMASGNAHVLFLAMNASGQASFRTELRSFQGDYQIRDVALQDNGAQIYTDWVPLTDELHSLETRGQVASGTDVGDGTLRLWLDGEPRADISDLDNDTRGVDKVRWGAVSGVDTGTRGTYYFDAFVSTAGQAIGPDPEITLPVPPPAPDLIFADGFESGDLDAWAAVKSDGGLQVKPEAALVGAFGVEAAINDTALLYVTDWSPFAEKQYRARFTFDPNNLAMLDGRSHILFQALTGSSTVVARIELRMKSGNYEIRSGLLTSDSGWLNTGWWYISDEPQTIEIHWWASASSETPEGGLTMWINRVQSETRAAVQNFGLQVDFARLGIVAGVDAGTLGSMYFDAFDSHRETPIGLP